MPIVNAFANGYIELPQKIKNTKSCVNIKNKDSKCFLWSHLLYLRYRLNGNNKIEHPERLFGQKAYIYNDKILHVDYDGINCLIAYNNITVIKDIEKKTKLQLIFLNINMIKKMILYRIIIVKIHLKIH